jgi:membrane-bound lytic murein transglycosylase B
VTGLVQPSRRTGSPRRRLAALVVAVTLLFGDVATASVSGAQAGDPPSPPGSSTPAPPSPEIVTDQRLTPGLERVPVDSSAYRTAVRDWQDTLAGIAEARRTVTTNEDRIRALDDERGRDEQEATTRRAAREVATVNRDRAQALVDELAVSSYVRGGPGYQAVEVLAAPDITDRLYSDAIVNGVSTDQLDLRRRFIDEVNALTARIDELDARLAQITIERQQASDTIDQAVARGSSLTTSIPAREQAVRDRRMGATVTGTDMTLVALDAYVKAGRRVAAERPQCRIDWWMIAALGRIESAHGTIFGSQVQPNGQTTVRIVGPPLDGTNRTMRIVDTDKGALDGDAVLDRAVGPMQFLPETWRAYQRDGNGDGARDPHNLYDAALAAGVYLCARAPELASEAGRRAAYFAYNRSDEYVSTAIDNGARYAQLRIPSPS